jgi:NADP-dependent 3-hydroxy acid dehydrogenase YdfG
MSLIQHRLTTNLLAPLTTLLFTPIFILSSAYLRISQNYSIPKHLRSFQPADKVIVITGASSGIGKALALRYAKQGAGVLILVARRKERLEQVKKECLDFGAKEVLVEVVDVVDEAQVSNAMKKIGAQYERIDLLVLNAGVFQNQKVSSMASSSLITQTMQINFLGSVHFVVHSLPYLKKSERGKIVGISSGFGIGAGPLCSGYSASKFALKGFLDSLRVEEPGLDITMVYPGVVKTEISE